MNIIRRFVLLRDDRRPVETGADEIRQRLTHRAATLPFAAPTQEVGARSSDAR